MIPLEKLPIEYQHKYSENGAIRMAELREFHQHEARFCELQRLKTVKHASADASAYNKAAAKLGYNIRVISCGDRIFAYKTDDAGKE